MLIFSVRSTACFGLHVHINTYVSVYLRPPDGCLQSISLGNLVLPTTYPGTAGGRVHALLFYCRTWFGTRDTTRKCAGYRNDTPVTADAPRGFLRVMPQLHIGCTKLADQFVCNVTRYGTVLLLGIREAHLCTCCSLSSHPTTQHSTIALPSLPHTPLTWWCCRLCLQTYRATCRFKRRLWSCQSSGHSRCSAYENPEHHRDPVRCQRSAPQRNPLEL